jgi:hypothetical protein
MGLYWPDENGVLNGAMGDSFVGYWADCSEINTRG